MTREFPPGAITWHIGPASLGGGREIIAAESTLRLKKEFRRVRAWVAEAVTPPQRSWGLSALPAIVWVWPRGLNWQRNWVQTYRYSFGEGGCSVAAGAKRFTRSGISRGGIALWCFLPSTFQLQARIASSTVARICN